jgi:hypothetical protein
MWPACIDSCDNFLTVSRYVLGTTSWKKTLSFYRVGEWNCLLSNPDLYFHSITFPDVLVFPTPLRACWWQSFKVRSSVYAILNVAGSPTSSAILATFSLRVDCLSFWAWALVTTTWASDHVVSGWMVLAPRQYFLWSYHILGCPWPLR